MCLYPGIPGASDSKDIPGCVPILRWVDHLGTILISDESYCRFRAAPFSGHGRRSVCLHQQSFGLLILCLPDVSQLQVSRPGHLRLLIDDHALPPTPFSIPWSTAGLPSHRRKCGFGGESSIQECGILNLLMLLNAAPKIIPNEILGIFWTIWALIFIKVPYFSYFRRLQSVC